MILRQQIEKSAPRQDPADPAERYGLYGLTGDGTLKRPEAHLAVEGEALEIPEIKDVGTVCLRHITLWVVTLHPLRGGFPTRLDPPAQ